MARIARKTRKSYRERRAVYNGSLAQEKFQETGRMVFIGLNLKKSKREEIKNADNLFGTTGRGKGGVKKEERARGRNFKGKYGGW